MYQIFISNVVAYDNRSNGTSYRIIESFILKKVLHCSWVSYYQESSFILMFTYISTKKNNFILIIK